eukprot:766294-Hanusia_phi.AAC.9
MRGRGRALRESGVAAREQPLRRGPQGPGDSDESALAVRPGTVPYGPFTENSEADPQGGVTAEVGVGAQKMRSLKKLYLLDRYLHMKIKEKVGWDLRRHRLLTDNWGRGYLKHPTRPFASSLFAMQEHRSEGSGCSSRNSR